MEDILNQLNKINSGSISKDIDQAVAAKKRLAIWISSNCAYSPSVHRRTKLANDLYSAGLDLDRRGACYSNRIENIDIIKEYKFYLAFENSENCTDYITEKVFRNGYLMNTVPVVWGGKKSDYEAIIPPHSYIFAKDFTVTQLAKYLQYLDKNVTAYKEYFKWRYLKVEAMPQYGRVTGLCQICRVLHGINVDNLYNPNYNHLKTYIPLFGYSNRSRIVPSLNEWYTEHEPKECFNRKN